MKILVVEPLQAPYAMDVELTEEVIRELVGEHHTMYGPFVDGGNLIIYNHKDELPPLPIPFFIASHCRGKRSLRNMARYLYRV